MGFQCVNRAIALECLSFVSIYYQLQRCLEEKLPLLYYVQNSCIGIVLIAVMLYYVLGQGGKRQALDSLFILLLLSTLALLSLEMFRHIFKGKMFFGARALHTTSVFFFFLCNPLLGYFYFLYIDQMENRWWRIPLRMGIIGAIPLLLSSLFTIASLWNGMIFSIDDLNNYARGPHFFLVPFTNMIYLIGGQSLNIYHIMKQGKKPINIYHIIFPLPLLTASILQAHNEQVEALFIAVTLTLLMTYLHIQNTYASRDYLTSLYNRSVAEQSLAHLFQHRKDGELIGGILMDIDTFKEVNDKYGHDFGDRCLRHFSQILTTSFSRNWTICRYGGDEFLLFSKMQSAGDMEEALMKFKKNMDHFNTTDNLPFVLSTSMGYGFAEESPTSNPTVFLKSLDERMYLIKRYYHKGLHPFLKTKDSL